MKKKNVHYAGTSCTCHTKMGVILKPGNNLVTIEQASKLLATKLVTKAESKIPTSYENKMMTTGSFEKKEILIKKTKHTKRENKE